MLQAIRGKAASWIVKILFVLLIFSFGAWGIADYIRSASQPSVVAEVGPVSIDPGQFSQAVSAEMQRFRQMLGGNFDRDQARQFGLPDRVIEQIVERTLLELEARRIGVTISDDVVRDAIRNNPAFKDETGNFSRDRFAAVITRAGYSEDRFIAEIRRDLARTQLVRPITDGAAPPKTLAETILNYRGERRVADSFLVPLAAAPAAPSDAQLEEYLKANAARFMRPEYRTLSYLSLSPAELMSHIELSDAELKDAYGTRLDEFTTPEKRTVEQLLINDQATADKASQLLGAGGDFEAVAKELGKAADKTSLGAVVKDDLPTEFAGPIFELPSGGVSKPIKSGFGWHVFKITEIQPGSVEPFDQVKDRLRDELKRDKAADQVPELANRLEDALAAGGTLEEIAQKLDLPLWKIAMVDQRGNGPDGKPVPDLPAGKQLLGTAFGLGNNATSQLVDAGNDGYLVVHVDAITASVLPPLAEIKDQVSSAWTAAQRDSATKQRADALAEKIRSGTEFAKAAAEAGAAVKATAPFGRDGAGAELPNAVVTQLFGGPIGTVAVAAGPDGYIVARLTKIEPVDPTTADAQRTKLTSELHQALGNDLLQQFETGLRERFRVRINQTAVEQGL